MLGDMNTPSTQDRKGGHTERNFRTNAKEL